MPAPTSAGRQRQDGAGIDAAGQHHADRDVRDHLVRDNPLQLSAQRAHEARPVRRHLRPVAGRPPVAHKVAAPVGAYLQAVTGRDLEHAFDQRIGCRHHHEGHVVPEMSQRRTGGEAGMG
ncbi:hypothetical protein ACVWWG_003794 [Bradyrhizobium sp. LB7.2]